MRLLTLLCFFAAFVLAGCDRQPGAKPAPPRSEIPALPAIKPADIPAPPIAGFTLERGMTLEHAAEKAYGHRRFSAWLAELNRIPDVTKVAAGTVLKTPRLVDGLTVAGLPAASQPAFCALNLAVENYRAVLPEYKAVRSAGQQRGVQKIDLPPALAKRLADCADLTDSAARALSEATTSETRPRSTLRQFENAAEILRTLSTGAIDEIGYDQDMIWQHFANGFAYALIWAGELRR